MSNSIGFPSAAVIAKLLLFFFDIVKCVRFELGVWFTTEFPSAGAVYRKLVLSFFCGLPSTVKSRVVRVMVSCDMSG